MSKLLFVTATLVSCWALFADAGSYYYNNQPHPAGPPPQYLPNYDVVLPPPDYETVNVAHGWENLPWQPITQFPWPGPAEHHGPPPHYHYGSKKPCYKQHVKTTTTHKPTTTTTTTTTTTPRPTKKHLLADLALTHGIKHSRK